MEGDLKATCGRGGEDAGESEIWYCYVEEGWTRGGRIKYLLVRLLLVLWIIHIQPGYR